MALSKLICIGHRGAAGHLPENTLASIAYALELGCKWIEVDVHFVDGQLAVIHDFSLDRTTNGTGQLENKTFEYLRSLDAGNGELIPTLGEVFDLVIPRAGINVELKGKNTAKPVAQFIASRAGSELSLRSVMVSSFDHQELLKFKELASEVPVGVLLEKIPSSSAAIGEVFGAYSLNISLESVNRDFIEDAKRRGIKVFVYTVNEPNDIVRMRQMGVDGVFSDFPDRVFASEI